MISIEVQEKLGPGLSRQVAGFDDARREQVSAAMGGEVRSLIVRHLTELAASRHTTANRLGPATLTRTSLTFRVKVVRDLVS